eukprot:962186-Amorphochlora_amoeboformis.AAC.2
MESNHMQLKPASLRGEQHQYDQTNMYFRSSQHCIIPVANSHASQAPMASALAVAVAGDMYG